MKPLLPSSAHSPLYIYLLTRFYDYSLSSHCLCRLHHQLILYLDDEVAYLSVDAPNTLPASLCGHLKSSAASICETPKSLALHPLMRESTWQQESKLICV